MSKLNIGQLHKLFEMPARNLTKLIGGREQNLSGERSQKRKRRRWRKIIKKEDRNKKEGEEDDEKK